MKTRSSAKSERARKAAREEKKLKMEEKQEQNAAVQKEKERLRKEAGVVAEVRKKCQWQVDRQLQGFFKYKEMMHER